MALETELSVYQARLPELRGSEGKFALVHGNAIDVFETYDDALKHGYRTFGLAPFLVKRIQAFEYPIFVSRLMAPCASAVTSHPQKGGL